jgi:trigger factor
MQVTLEKTSGLERRMRISVPADQLDSKVDEKLKQTAGQVKIKGFRPGKVPMREVKRRFGEGIRQEVSSEVMQTSYAAAIQEQDVSPAGMPQIEDVNMEAGKDLEFTAVFEVFPEIELADFANISVEKVVSSVTDADVETMIANNVLSLLKLIENVPMATRLISTLTVFLTAKHLMVVKAKGQILSWVQVR